MFLKHLSLALLFLLFASAARGSLAIRVEGFDPSEPVTIRVVDIMGKVVLSELLGERRSATYTSELLRRGAYIVIISGRSRSVAERVVME